MSGDERKIVYRLAADDVQWRNVEGEVLALDTRQSEYLGVNRSGAVLWAALADGATRDALVQHLVTAESVDADRAGRDVDAFLAQLRERGLLTERRAA